MYSYSGSHAWGETYMPRRESLWSLKCFSIGIYDPGVIYALAPGSLNLGEFIGDYDTGLHLSEVQSTAGSSHAAHWTRPLSHGSSHGSIYTSEVPRHQSLLHSNSVRHLFICILTVLFVEDPVTVATVRTEFNRRSSLSLRTLRSQIKISLTQ